MTDLRLIETRIRILLVLLGKRIEQYHQVTLHGDLTKRHEIHGQIFDLRRAIDRLEFERRRAGGAGNEKQDRKA